MNTYDHVAMERDESSDFLILALNEVLNEQASNNLEKVHCYMQVTFQLQILVTCSKK